MDLLYKSDNSKDGEEKSLEEKKAELCLTLSLAKIHFALKQDKRTSSTGSVKVSCVSKPHTMEWADELLETLDREVNRPCSQMLKNLYIAEKEIPIKAAKAFQSSIQQAKESRMASSVSLFDPWKC